MDPNVTYKEYGSLVGKGDDESHPCQRIEANMKVILGIGLVGVKVLEDEVSAYDPFSILVELGQGGDGGWVVGYQWHMMVVMASGRSGYR